MTLLHHIPDAPKRRFAVVATLVLAGCLSGGGGSETSPALIVDPLSVTAAAAATTPTRTIALNATGGTPPYSWSLPTNASGATVSGSNATASYQAGVTTGGDDEVQATDSAGRTAKATIRVVPAIAVSPGTMKIAAVRSKTFSATGGSGTGYRWRLSTNRSGGTIVPATGAYTSGPTVDVIDVVSVEDSLGITATIEVDVSLPPATRAFPLIFAAGSSGAVRKLDATGSIVLPNPFVAGLGVTTDVGGPAFDSAGNMYVPAFAGNKIVKVTPAGVVSDFVSNALLGNPQMCAFDRQGNLYVTAFASHRVIKVSADGQTVTAFITTGLQSPAGIAFDSRDNIYVANYGSGNVSAFTIDGTALTTWGTNGVVGVANGPVGLAFDDAGNLFVTRFQTTAIQRIDRAGTTVTAFVSSGISQPAGLVIDTQGNLYVGSYGGTIYKVTAAGAVSTFSTGHTSVRAFTLSP